MAGRSRGPNVQGVREPFTPCSNILPPDPLEREALRNTARGARRMIPIRTPSSFGESSPSDNEADSVDTTEYAPVGSICSVHKLYQSEKDGYSWVKEPPKGLLPPSENSESTQYALLARHVRCLDGHRNLKVPSFLVQSNHIKEFLADVFEDYPGMSAGDVGVLPLAEIMRHHTELLVHPLFWTSRHLEMMGFQFQRVSDATQHEQHKDDQQFLNKLSKEVESEAQALVRSLGLQVNLKAAINTLLSKGIILNKLKQGPDFVFAGRCVHRPLYTVFYRKDQPEQFVCEGPLPVVGYVNYTDVSGPRWHKFVPHSRRGRTNLPVSRICKIKRARVTPQDWKEEPYFACILLSLAQVQENLFKPKMPIIYLSRLLVTSFKDRDSIHIYKARIPSELLKSLENPSAAMTKSDLITIEHIQIPAIPFETLPRRILAELSVTDVSPSNLTLADVNTSADQ